MTLLHQESVRLHKRKSLVLSVEERYLEPHRITIKMETRRRFLDYTYETLLLLRPRFGTTSEEAVALGVEALERLKEKELTLL